jgi:hypothetical protein
MSGPSPSHASRVADLAERLKQPRTLASLALFGVAIVIIAGFTLFGMNADRSVADHEGVDDDQLDATLLSLGAVGVSDSANPAGPDSPTFGALDLTAQDSSVGTEPAPLFALDEPAPAIMFEQAKVSTGPLFGAPRSVPSQGSSNDYMTSQQTTGVITANGTTSPEFAVPQFGAPAGATTGLQATPATQNIRPVSGVRSAAWLTGTIE